MSNDETAACDEEEPCAKRLRHMATADPNHQTLGSAVSAAHAVHAEPGGSSSRGPQPAAAAAARCVSAAFV